MRYFIYFFISHAIESIPHTLGCIFLGQSDMTLDRKNMVVLYISLATFQTYNNLLRALTGSQAYT